MVVLTLFSFTSCSNTPESNTGALTIRVSDATPKMIGFDSDDGIVRMTHYGISLKDASGAELKAADTPMPFYGDTGSFTITGLVSGSYTIDATGYVKNADGYTAIATGTTGKFDLTSTTNETKDILIDTWEEGNAESVTVEVTLPSDVLTGGTGEGTLTYRLTDVNDTDVISEKSVSVAAASVQDGKYTLTIPESVAPGRYVLIVGFTGTGSEKAYKAASAMLVYPNLPITGSISLDSQSAFDGSFTVTNGIGDIIEVDGRGEYQAESGTIVVTLTKALGENEAVKWYVDGVAASPANEGLKYTFTGIEAGKRTIVGVVYNTETDAAVGEIVINVSMAEPEIIPESIFTFDLNSDGKSYTVTGLKEGAVQEDPEVFEIPSEHEGLPVTGVESYAFNGEKNITGRLVISDTIVNIGSDAFRECSGLTGNLIIPDSVESIGGGAFANCGFNGTLKLSENEKFTVIEDNTFGECFFVGELIIPDNIEEIVGYDNGMGASYGAFQNNKFDSLKLSEGLITIGSDVFADNPFKGNLELPSSLKSIGSNAFENCNGFTGDLMIPDCVLEIERQAFKGCSGFDGQLVISDTVKTVGGSTFAGCSSFSSITLGNSLEKIAAAMFSGCSGIRGDLIIPDNIVEIGGTAFDNCGIDGNLSIGENVNVIEERAFSGNKFTGVLIIPESVVEIGERAFENNGFSGVLTLAEDLQTIGGYAFKGNQFTAINCVPLEKPVGWDDNWDYGCEEIVTWGYTGE